MMGPVNSFLSLFARLWGDSERRRIAGFTLLLILLSVFPKFSNAEKAKTYIVKSVLGEGEYVTLAEEKERFRVEKRAKLVPGESLPGLCTVCIPEGSTVELVDGKGNEIKLIGSYVYDLWLADPGLVREPSVGLEQIQTELYDRISQLSRFSSAKVSMSAKVAALSRLIPDSIWLDQMLYQQMSDSEQSDLITETQPGKEKALRVLSLIGLCFLGNADQEVQAVNQWIKALSEEKTFLEGFQAITLEEIRREESKGQNATRFRILCR